MHARAASAALRTESDIADRDRLVEMKLLLPRFENDPCPHTIAGAGAGADPVVLLDHIKEYLLLRFKHHHICNRPLCF